MAALAAARALPLPLARPISDLPARETLLNARDPSLVSRGYHWKYRYDMSHDVGEDYIPALGSCPVP